MTPAQLVNEATSAILSDPALASNLSPQSVLLSQVVSTTIAAATGELKASDVALALASEITSQLATEMAKSAISDVAGAAPAIGQLLQVFGMISDAVAEVAANDAQNEAEAYAVRSAIEKFFVAVKTNAEGVVPADIFAPYDATDAQRLGGTFWPQTSASISHVEMPDPVGTDSVGDARLNQHRSLLGHCLVSSTEGIGPYSLDAGGGEGPSYYHTGGSNPKNVHYDAWITDLRAGYTKLKKLGAPLSAIAWMQNAGVPKGRREIFTKLRRAIQAQRKVSGGDGGVSLWAPYQDLLRLEFDQGHLSRQFISLAGNGGMSIQGHKGYGYPGTAKMIEDMVAAWELRLEPWYAEGQAAQERAREEALAIAEEMGPKNRLTALAIAISSSPPPTKRRRIVFNW